MVFSPIGTSIAADSTPELSHLLLFDTDPHGLAVLASRFGRHGFTVLASGDLARVRELVRTSTASVLLVGVHASQPETLALLREAGRLPRQHPLTCLAFGRPELREAALAAGALAFLPIPIFINDVVSASRLLAGGAGVVRGGLAQIEVSLPLDRLGSVYHLIRVFTVLGRSAVVEATRGPKAAELRFIDGALTSVDVPPWQGLAALHQILLWEKADLQVKFTKVGRRGRQLSLKPAEVLGECDRFLRDFAHGVAGLGDARTIFAPNAARRPAPQMPSEVIPVLRQFDGQHDLAQVLADSPFGIFDTLRIVKRFVGDDAIIPVAPVALAPPETGSEEPGREPHGSAARLEGPAALDVWFRRSSVDGIPMEAPRGNARTKAANTATEHGPKEGRASESGAAADANAGMRAPTIVSASLSPSGAEPPSPTADPPNASGGVVRRPTPLSMVATGELRIPGNTPPQPRAAVTTLRLVPGVIVDLSSEPTPTPARAPAHPAASVGAASGPATPTEEPHPHVPPSLASADVLTPPPRPPLVVGQQPTSAVTVATELRRPAGVVAQGEIRVARPSVEAPSRRQGLEIPSILVDLPTVVVVAPTALASTPPSPTALAPTPPSPTALAPTPPSPASPVPKPSAKEATEVKEAKGTNAPVPRDALAASQAQPAREPVAHPPLAASDEQLARPTPPLVMTAPAQAPGRPAPRPHASPFSDVESDFFNREADLYTSSSVETFDDLDGKPVRTRSGSGPRRS